MSSISNLPYGKILDYWYEKLKGHKHRNKFLITKFVEAVTFKSNTKTLNKKYKYVPFPSGKKHELPIKPKIALVVPVYAQHNKEIQDLEELFFSIENLVYQPDIVIIVDDGSPKNYYTPEHFVKLNNKSNYGPAKSRNRGIEIALNNKADIIAFTDADCILDKNWTKHIVFHFQQYPRSGIVSGNTASKDKHWFGTYHNMNGTLNGRKFKQSDRLLYGTTANLAVTAEVCRSVKFNDNFPIAAGEDIEFCFRANKKGFEINYNQEMVVYHHYGYSSKLTSSLNRFRSQFKKYSKGEKILLEYVPEYYAYFNETEEISVE